MNKLPKSKQKELYKKVRAMKKQGMKYIDICKELGYKNVNSITHILKNYK